MLRRRLLVVLPVLALGATAAVLVPGGTATASPETQGGTYVAMGDSYAAGYGLPPSEGTPTGEPVPGCAQTTGDYPHLLAGDLGLDLTDVSCSGARTVDFTNPQVTDAGTAPPQTDVFDTIKPDLVTITIGGNDLGFSNISVNCLAGGANGPVFLHPTFNSCKAYFESLPAGSTLNPYNRIASTLAAVDGAIKAVKAATPDSEIAVIAYPAIAPDAANTPAAGCYRANALPAPITLPGFPITVNSAFPFTDADVPFLQVLQEQLNDGIAATAAANGAAYADVYPASLAHSACEPEANRWVEPIIPADAAAGARNSVHPNLAGTTAMAATLAPVVEALFAPPPTTTAPPTAPTTDSSTGASGSGASTVVAGGGEPLADTGTSFPVGGTVGLAAALLVAGAVALGFARPRRARHSH